MHLFLIVSFTPIALVAAILHQIPTTTFKYGYYSTIPRFMPYKAEETNDMVACASSVLLYPDDQAAGFNYEDGLCKVYTQKGRQGETIEEMFRRINEMY